MLDNSPIRMRGSTISKPENQTIPLENLVEQILEDYPFFHEFSGVLTTYYNERLTSIEDDIYDVDMDWFWSLGSDEDSRNKLLIFLTNFFGGSTVTSEPRLLDEIKYICKKWDDINQCLDIDGLVWIELRDDLENNLGSLISERLEKFLEIGMKNVGAAPSTTKCEELV